MGPPAFNGATDQTLAGVSITDLNRQRPGWFLEGTSRTEKEPWCVGAKATTERLAWRVPQGSPQHAGTAPLGTKVERYCEQSARSAVAAKLQAHFAGIVIPSRVPWKKRRLRGKREEAVKARVRHHCGVATGGPCRLQIHDKIFSHPTRPWGFTVDVHFPEGGNCTPLRSIFESPNTGLPAFNRATDQTLAGVSITDLDETVSDPAGSLRAPREQKRSKSPRKRTSTVLPSWKSQRSYPQ
ncbi:hypothetical protein THAOC_19640 [Thalassiosira oceanica]|uniref:Uncharacterized protein n=1 Tax=Thalassiosira oceanica TaxID=159749 RepID=K0S5B7_THAOC|nr:hypothetical protein THAOC_19640 [Thalassiosira oceanica]|eukprot:EJK60074.1 hypothetical protein THAOC_19640 [Thalassiosira oceanica]